MPATMMMMILTMTGLYHGEDKSAYEYIEDAGHVGKTQLALGRWLPLLLALRPVVPPPVIVSSSF